MTTRRRFLSYSAVAPAVLGSAIRGRTLFADVLSEADVSARARAIEKRALVFDGHVHALDREFYPGGSMGTRTNEGQWDLQRAIEGGVKAFFLSIYVPEAYLPGRFETRQAIRRVDHALQQIEQNKDRVELALNAADIRRITSAGKVAAVLDIEGSYDLDGDLGILRDLYRSGLRSAQLSAHNWDQNYADSCCVPPKSNGLSAHGKEVIREMNRLGMVINVSHSSDETISQAIDASDAPVVATHHGLRSVNDIPRLMPDWLLKKLAAKGGVMGFQIGTEFASRRVFEYLSKQRGKSFSDTGGTEEKARGMTLAQVDAFVAGDFPMAGMHLPDDVNISIDDWVGVVDRAIELAGDDHISLGSDFDGGPPLARGMRDVRDLPMITEAMLRRGYSEPRIDKFLGGNLLRVFDEITSKKRS